MAKPRTPLPGNQISHGLETPPPVPDRERGILDAQNIAEFLEYDLPFHVEPAIAFVFPKEAPDE